MIDLIISATYDCQMSYIETLPRKASIHQVVDSGTMLNIEWMVICAF